MKYADMETNIAYGDLKNDKAQKLIVDQVKLLLGLFSLQGDSGFSAAYKLSMFNKLVKFENLTKLSFDDSEFDMESYGFDFKQNKRNSKVFKELSSNRYTYNDSFVKVPQYTITGDGTVTENVFKSHIHGGIVVLKENGSMYYFRKSIH